MDPTTDELKRDIDATREAMTGKLEQIEAHVKNSVDETVGQVKGAVDIRRHVIDRPWAALGAIAVAGFAVGHLRGPADRISVSRSRMNDDPGFVPGTRRLTEVIRPVEAGAARARGLLDEVVDQLGGPQLKAAAVAAVVGAAGDWLKKNLPRFGTEIERARGQNVRSNGTRKTAEQPAHDSVGDEWRPA